MGVPKLGLDSRTLSLCNWAKSHGLSIDGAAAVFYEQLVCGSFNYPEII